MEFSCEACGSRNVRRFKAEANIHFAVQTDSAQESVFAFPTLLICLDCGLVKGNLSDGELRILREGPSRSGHTAAA